MCHCRCDLVMWLVTGYGRSFRPSERRRTVNNVKYFLRTIKGIKDTKDLPRCGDDISKSFNEVCFLFVFYFSFFIRVFPIPFSLLSYYLRKTPSLFESISSTIGSSWDVFTPSQPVLLYTLYLWILLCPQVDVSPLFFPCFLNLCP